MLNAYSSQSLAVLLNGLPHLKNLVTVMGETFEIEAITPAGWPFWVSSDNDELTVGFAEYHLHFGGSDLNEPQEDATQAVAFIHSLQTGQLVLAAWYENGQYVSGQPIEPREDPYPRTWFSRWWRRKQQLQVKSWG